MSRTESGPKILPALETSGDVCGVAILRAGRLVVEQSFRHERHLSERLMGVLDSALALADTTLQDVDMFAVGIGPGSFTGTRIGVMTAKTLATVEGKPIFGVTSLAALAMPYVGLADTLIVPMLPCRAGVVYAGLFRVESAIPEALSEAGAFSIPDLAAQIQNETSNRIILCGAASNRYAEALKSSGISFFIGNAASPRAAHIAEIAYRRLASGAEPQSALDLVPCYLSPPPITLPKTPIPLPQSLS